MVASVNIQRIFFEKLMGETFIEKRQNYTNQFFLVIFDPNSWEVLRISLQKVRSVTSLTKPEPRSRRIPVISVSAIGFT